MNFKDWINKYIYGQSTALAVNLPESEGVELGAIQPYNRGQEFEDWQLRNSTEIADAKMRAMKNLDKYRERAQDYSSRASSVRREAKAAIKETGDIPALADPTFKINRNLDSIYNELGDVTKESLLTRDNLTHLSEEAELRTARLLEELRGSSNKYAVLTPNRKAITKELVQQEDELVPLMRELLGEENQFIMPQHLQELEKMAGSKGIKFNYKDYPVIDREMKMLGSDTLFFDRPVLSKMLGKLPPAEGTHIMDTLLDIAKENKFNNLDKVINHVNKNPNKFARRLGGLLGDRSGIRNVIDDLRRGAENLTDAEKLNWDYLDLTGLENIEHPPLGEVLRNLRQIRNKEQAPLGILHNNLGFGESALNSSTSESEVLSEGSNFNEGFSGDSNSEYFSPSDTESEYFDAIENVEEPIIRNAANEEVESAARAEGKFAKGMKAVGKGVKVASKGAEVLQVVDMLKQGAAVGRNYREQIEDKGLASGTWQGMKDSFQHGTYMIADMMDAQADFNFNWQPLNWFRPKDGYTSIVGEDPIAQRFTSDGIGDDIANYGKGFINDMQYIATGEATAFDENYGADDSTSLPMPEGEEPQENVNKRRTSNMPIQQTQPLKDILIASSVGAGQGIATTSTFRF